MKQIKKSKIIFDFFIIFIMLLGAMFFIYRIYRLQHPILNENKNIHKSKVVSVVVDKNPPSQEKVQAPKPKLNPQIQVWESLEDKINVFQKTIVKYHKFKIGRENPFLSPFLLSTSTVEKE